jgi:propanediol dehydratase small subunit
MAIEYKTKIVTTTPYTIANDDEVIFVNVPSASNVILTASSSGKAVYIKDYSGLATKNPITITAAGGKTIDGVSFAILNGGYSHIQIVYDGTNWKTIS